MPVGIQIRDPGTGELVIDYTTHTGFILGSFVVDLAHQSGSLTDASLPEGAIWSVGIMDPAGGDPGDAPLVTKSGTTLTWSRFASGRSWQGRIFYGVR